MPLPHQNKIDIGAVNGAYVPASVFQYQEYQRQKLKTAFRNRPVFLETKIETAIVNKPVVKKSASVVLEPVLASWDEGAVLPSFVTLRQDNEKVKNEAGLKKLKAEIQSTFVTRTIDDTKQHSFVLPVASSELVASKPDIEEMVLPSFIMLRQDNQKLKNEAGLKKLKSDTQCTFVVEKSFDYSDDTRQYSFVLPKSTNTSPNRNARRKSFELLRGSKKEYEIGQEFLADCGLSTHWVFKCAPWKELPICVENESDGAWVPFIVLYQVDYYECSFVKEHSQGREFSQDHGPAYD